MRLLVSILLLSGFTNFAHAACYNPTGVAGDIRFNAEYKVFQGCTGNDWMAFHEAGCTGSGDCPPDPCESSPAPGATCADGSIYAGLSPDGNVPMYTTPADAPSLLDWNDGTGNHQDTGMQNCSSSETSCNSGEANTALLIGATGEPDYPLAAAEYCEGLSAHGHSDWYLPAKEEMNVMCANRNSGALDGSFSGENATPFSYWTSSEDRAEVSWAVEFLDAGPCFNSNSNSKSNNLNVRCVRKE